MDTCNRVSTNSTNSTISPEINLHERSSPAAIVEATTLIIIMIASFFANILALAQILSSSKLIKHHHNLLIANLNVIDLGVVTLSMTFSVVTIMDNGSLLSTNRTVCTVNGFFAVTCTVGNFITVMCIAVDRYLSIVWSTRFPPTRRRMILMIVFIWVSCIAMGMPPAVGILTIYEYTAQTHHCSPKWDTCSYYIIWATVIFIITIPVMIICYVCIIYHIAKSDRLLRSFDTPRKSTKLSKKLPTSGVRGNHRKNLNLRLHCFRYTFPHGPNQPTSNTRGDDKYKGNPDDAFDGNVNDGFQGEEIVHHKIVYDESFLDDMKSGPYVISGRIGQQATSPRNLADGRHNRRMSTPCHLQNDPWSSSTDSTMPGRSGNKISAKKRRLGREKRVAVTGAMLIFTTIMCWTPYSVIHFCQLPIPVSHPVAVTTMWMGYINSLLDPLVYFFMNRKEKFPRHLSGVLRNFCNWPRKAWRRLCSKNSDD